MSTQSPEKRQFHRIAFDALCELHCGETVWQTEVLDISLKGVLIKKPEGWQAPLNDPCELVIHLDDHERAIVMSVELCHVEDNHLGFKCQYIDLDSVTHLKRLVELNLGDPAMLERDFAHMVD